MSKVDSTTISFSMAWPVCKHERRFQISRKWWIIKWIAWVCPDCRDLVSGPKDEA